MLAALLLGQHSQQGNGSQWHCRTQRSESGSWACPVSLSQMTQGGDIITSPLSAFARKKPLTARNAEISDLDVRSLNKTKPQICAQATERWDNTGALNSFPQSPCSLPPQDCWRIDHLGRLYSIHENIISYQSYQLSYARRNKTYQCHL